jgi:hypothetical protein
VGYRVEDRKLILDEEEAATVRRIFERYLALRSISKLQAELRLGFLGSAFRYAASVWRQTLRGFFLSPLVYVFEPLFLHANFRKLTSGESKKAFALAQSLHNVALAISAFTIAAGVLGAHGALD